jgi:hypothetical protein
MRPSANLLTAEPFEQKGCFRVKVYVYRQGLMMGYTVDPEVFPAPQGWMFSRPIEVNGTAKTLIAVLARDGFYVPSVSP